MLDEIVAPERPRRHASLLGIATPFCPPFKLEQGTAGKDGTEHNKGGNRQIRNATGHVAINAMKSVKGLSTVGASQAALHDHDPSMLGHVFRLDVNRNARVRELFNQRRFDLVTNIVGR